MVADKRDSGGKDGQSASVPGFMAYFPLQSQQREENETLKILVMTTCHLLFEYKQCEGGWPHA